MNKPVHKPTQLLPYSTQLYQRHRAPAFMFRTKPVYATINRHRRHTSVITSRAPVSISRQRAYAITSPVSISSQHASAITSPVPVSISHRHTSAITSPVPVPISRRKMMISHRDTKIPVYRKTTNHSQASTDSLATGSMPQRMRNERFIPRILTETLSTDSDASQSIDSGLSDSQVNPKLMAPRLKISSDCIKILDNGFVTMSIVLVGYGKVIVESIIFDQEPLSYITALTSKSLPVTLDHQNRWVIVDTDLSDSQASFNVTFYFPYVYQVSIPMTVTYNIDQSVTHYLKFSELPKVQETPGRIIKIDHSQFGTDLDYSCLNIKWGSAPKTPSSGGHRLGFASQINTRNELSPQTPSVSKPLISLGKRICNKQVSAPETVSTIPLISELSSDAAMSAAGVGYTNFQIIGDHQYVYYFFNQGEKIPVKYYQNIYESPIGHTFSSSDIQEIWIVVNEDRQAIATASRVPVAFNNSWIKINSVFQIIKKINLNNLRPNAMTLQFRVYPIGIPIRFKLVLNDSNSVTLVLAQSEITPSRQNVTVRLSMSIGETFSVDSYLELQVSTVLDNSEASIMIEDCCLD